MAEEDKKTVVLSDGQIVAKKRAKVKDLANAENQPKNKEHLVKYAQFAAQITIDGKPVVLEDVLELYADDLALIAQLFEDEAEKND